MAADVRIRTFELRDYEQVVDLWRAAGLSLSLSDDFQGIEHRMQRDPDLFIVAESSERIVGAVMGCYDGRRGWVNHLAVAPGLQRDGIGTMLMSELEARFRAVGCVKVNLLIDPTTAACSASTTASATPETTSSSWRRHSLRVIERFYLVVASVPRQA